MKTENYMLIGMTSFSCAHLIEKEVSKMDGVEEVYVNFTTETLTLSFDETKVNFENLRKIIIKLGYDIKSNDNIREVNVSISGMRSATCSQTIENNLKKSSGIIDVHVNLTTEKAKIIYNCDKIRITEIKNQIVKLGYNCIEKNDSKKINPNKKIIWKLIICVIFTILLLFITISKVYNFKLPFINQNIKPYPFSLIQFILTIPIIIVGFRIYINGYKNLLCHHPNSESLMAISSSIAFFYGLYCISQLGRGKMEYANNIYFEFIGIIMSTKFLSDYLDVITKTKIFRKCHFNFLPKNATIQKDGKEITIPINELEIGDVVIVKTGELIPIDGIIIDGRATVDEAMISGQSMAKEKGSGERVSGASLNKNGKIKVKVTKISNDISYIQMMQRATKEGTKDFQIATIFVKYYLAIVSIIAVVSGLIGLLIGIDSAFTIFILVLVIECPFAYPIVISLPVKISTKIGLDHGVIFNKPIVFENGTKIQTIIIDKTGTITQSKLEVTDIIIANNYHPEEVLLIAASVEKKSLHPFAEAIVNKAKKENLSLLEPSEILDIPGYGIEAKLDERQILIGNQKLIEDHQIYITLNNEIQSLSIQGKTPILLSVNNELVGVIAIADTIRPNSKKAIDMLIKMGFEVMITTGDNINTAKAISQSVGISKVLAEMLPNDKAKVINQLQAEGKKVVMIGDGINDTLALKEASISIMMTSSNDICINCADIILLNGDLLDVIYALQLSQVTMKNIKMNLYWVFIYNLLCILIAIGLFSFYNNSLNNLKIMLILMSFGYIVVLFNTFQLQRFKIKKL